MAVLDRDAIDCSTDENCELRENIEMMYNVKVCGRHIIVALLMVQVDSGRAILKFQKCC